MSTLRQALETEKAASRKGPPCGVSVVEARLDPDDLAALHEYLADRDNVTTAAITRALAADGHRIGKNTVEALQSGALYGFAGQVDGLVRRISAELGEVTAVVATGGLASLVLEESQTITAHEPDLTLIGLRLIHDRNRP